MTVGRLSSNKEQEAIGQWHRVNAPNPVVGWTSAPIGVDHSSSIIPFDPSSASSTSSSFIVETGREGRGSAWNSIHPPQSNPIGTVLFGNYSRWFDVLSVSHRILSSPFLNYLFYSLFPFSLFPFFPFALVRVLTLFFYCLARGSGKSGPVRMTPTRSSHPSS